MNWNEIGTQVILSVLGVIISGLGVYFTYLINKHIKNDELKRILTSLNDLIKKSVAEIQQIYVDDLKGKNMFDKEAQKQAIERCLESIKANMPNEVKSWLESNYTDIEAYLRSQIEAQVKLLKIGGC